MPVRNQQRRHLLALASCVSVFTPNAAVHAQSADAKRWAVMSLVGDGLEMVVASPPDSSRLDRGGRSNQIINGAGFDRAVLIGARAALVKSSEASNAALYPPPAALSAAEQREVVELMRKGTTIPWLVPMLEKDKVTHLVLVTRDSGDALIKTSHGDPAGERAVDGIGFYIDHHTRIRVENDIITEGFLAPFLYLRLSLFDVRQGKIVRHVLIRESTGFGAGTNTPERDPWKMWTNVQKIEYLRKSIVEQVEPALTRLMRPA